MKTPILTLIIFLFISNFSLAQNGPGGVGNTTGTSNLQLWLKANDCTGCSDGDLIAQWDDQSGAGHHVMSSGTSRPTFKENVANGFPGLQFNGGQFLQTDGTSSGFNPPEATIFVVAQGGMEGTLVASAENSWNNEMLLFDQNAFHHRSSGNFTVLEHHCLNSIPSNEVAIVVASFGQTATELDYSINGLLTNENLQSFGTPTDFTSVDRKITIGQRDQFVNSEFLNGTILEVIIYNNILSTEEHKQVQDYLQNKYSVLNNGCGNLLTGPPNGPGGVGSTSGDSNLKLWLRADDCNNCSTGDLVSSWQDASGYNNHVNAVGNSAPTFVESVTNGLPGVEFQGNQYLQTASADIDFSNTQATFFVVTLGQTEGAILASAREGFIDEMLLFNEQVYHHRSSGNFTTLEHQCIDNIPTTEPNIITAIFGEDPTDLSFFVNGQTTTESLQLFGSPNSFSNFDRIVTVGQRDQLTNSEYLQGTVMEVIIYDSKLSVEYQKKVENYLRCKYDVTNNDCGILEPNFTSISLGQNGTVLFADSLGTSFQWLDCNNNLAPIPGANEATFIPTAIGSYAVETTVNGCTLTSGCFNIIMVDTEDLINELDLTIFPNPVTDLLTIQQVGIKQLNIQIFDMRGVEVYSSTSKEKIISINMENLPVGMYALSVWTENKRTVQKIIKE